MMTGAFGNAPGRREPLLLVRSRDLGYRSGSRTAERSSPAAADLLSPRWGIPMTRPDKPTLPLAPGSGFGPYRLVRRLGVGGFAEVWEAERDDGIGSVALKILSAAKDVEPSALERFIQEGRIAAALSHPRTVYVFAAEQVGTHPVIAMELMRGGTLQDRLDRGERFSPAEVVEIALDLLDGLEAAHRQGIVHRDL